MLGAVQAPFWGNSGEMQVSNYKRQVFTFISVFSVCVRTHVCLCLCVCVCDCVCIVCVSFFCSCFLLWFCLFHSFSCTCIQFIYLMFCMDSRFKKETNFKKQIK